MRYGRSDIQPAAFRPDQEEEMLKYNKLINVFTFRTRSEKTPANITSNSFLA